MPPAVDPELLNHFTVVVYPFLHDVAGRRRFDRLDVLAERWSPWWSRLDEAGMADGLAATAFFLPYVRGLLYPEVAALHDQPPGTHYNHWTHLLRRWLGLGLESYCRQLPASVVLRLTLDPAVCRSLAGFGVVKQRTLRDDAPASPHLPACLDWVDALLFPSGVGFLLLKVRLRAERPRLSQLIELNQAMRLVHPPSLSWALPTLHFDSGGEPATLRDLLNFLLQGMTAAPVGDFQPLGTPSVGTAYTDGEAGLAYGERCQLFSYACAPLSRLGPDELPAGAFLSGEDRVLFEYAAGIGLGDAVDNPMWVPSPEQAERVRRDNRLAMWRCWKAMALKESCVFLGTEDLPFNRRSLPHTIEHDYLPLYLYTLHQKFQLTLFANDLMREVAQVESHLRGARALLRRFVAFRNRFWFSEVTRKPQGGELYRLFQQSLDVPGLYQMALTSVKEAKEYYEERWDRQVRLGLTLLTLGGPLAALLGVAPPLMDGVTFAAVALAASVAATLWLVRVRRRGRKSERARAHGPARLLAFPGKRAARKKAA